MPETRTPVQPPGGGYRIGADVGQHGDGAGQDQPWNVVDRRHRDAACLQEAPKSPVQGNLF